jgi:hypothetical protein
MRTGTADSPLHYGHTPRWLFERMSRLAREIVHALAIEFGPQEILRRLSDPFWFQAFGCTLGFDWHSSGLTTTVCGALKVGLRGLDDELGLWVAGGKGATSRRTPEEIAARAGHLAVDAGELIYASRMAAKVDNAALQDGYQIYHHCFIFDRQGHWAVIQQGMNDATGYARRYHWLSDSLRSFVNEPHAAVCCDATGEVLNLVAAESEAARQASTKLAHEHPDRLVEELERVVRLELPRRHDVAVADIHPRRLRRVFVKTYENPPQDFEALLSTPGVGPAGLRALSLLAELLYGAPTSHRDPARFSFAHGGKDGTPFPVNREVYDHTVATLEQAVARAKVGDRERLQALRRLSAWAEASHDTRPMPRSASRPSTSRPETVQLSFLRELFSRPQRRP